MKKYIFCLLLLVFVMQGHGQDPAYPASPANPQNIVAAESFIDIDPGEGLGNAISITAATDINNLAAAINVNGLTNGIHRLFIRTRNNEGSWSISQAKEFLYDGNPAYRILSTPQNIVAAEYFIDTDPGFGQGTAIPIVPGVDIGTISATISTASLSNGFHKLFIRTRGGEGYWSLVSSRDFIVNFDYPYTVATNPLTIITAEYFIDTDPGIGKASPITLTAGLDINNLSASINTAGLGTGSHQLGIRTKNAEGSWGITNIRYFIFNNDIAYPSAPAAPLNITAVEYFVDTDPGFGKAIPIAITPGTDLNNMNVSINTTGLTGVNHTLFIRSRNQEGSWSIVNNTAFTIGLLSIAPDSLGFGSVPINTTTTKTIVINNHGASSQSVTGITANLPYSTAASFPISIPAGGTVNLDISFAPTALQNYPDGLTIQSSAGNLPVKLTGTGVSASAAWTLAPVNGFNFGNIAVNTTSNTSFNLINTGNIPITLNNVACSDAAFVPSFTTGTVIPVGASISIPVAFTPALVQSYTSQLTVTTSTAGAITLTTTLLGNGYQPGAPPVIQFVTGTPFNGTNGVNPVTGQQGLYTYKILYKSANNLPPQANYPQVGIDLNGDGDFADLGEGVFNMVKEGSSTDYVTGVVYSYTFNQTALTSTAGYQFFAKDNNGNTAVGLNSAYKTGPLVTDQQLDLRIFANDISFSKNNPLPGESFTVTANISNSTVIPALNVPIKFYRDTILIATATLPAVNANSSASISQTLSFAAEGFYPIKVWIDSSNTLGDANILNNYAIRPITVGSPKLPGGITGTTSASVQQCPQVAVLISGTASYFGAGATTIVAGADVTINTGTQTLHTTTDASGNYSYLFTGVTCGGTLTYTVSITDFTFTSSLVTNSLSVPCTPAGTCVVPVSQGGLQTSVVTSPCGNMVGSSTTVNMIIKYRERDPANMWSLFDEIINDSLQIFQDGVLIQTIPSADGSYSPGDQVSIPVTIPVTGTAPVNVSGILHYTYVEYRQIPDNFYHGIRTNIVNTGQGTFTPVSNLPDLTVNQFTQTGFTAFNFTDANILCANAGPHQVQLFDSTAGGSFVLKNTYNVSTIPGKLGFVLNYSDPTMQPGIHFIKIVTDATGVVGEKDETNNTVVFIVNVPLPDLTVSSIAPTTTAVATGSPVKFAATIKNTGIGSGTFNVGFLVNGIPLGNKIAVFNLGEKDSVQVVSDTYIVPNSSNACGPVVEAIADVDAQVTESDETNNTAQIQLSADLSPFQLPTEIGSMASPVVVRVNTSTQFFPAIRNVGKRDASNVTVSYMLNGNNIGTGTIANIKAGLPFAAHGSFTYLFDTPGDYTVVVVTDTANTICESDETNNVGNFFIHVTDSKPDFEVLSQYISPSSLNPNSGQSITIVGTVRNAGGKATTNSVLRFLVDDIQLGDDVPLNALQPGKDTTVLATATYSSIIPGIKTMKIVADPANLVVEEREDNNVATRTMIVGDAPDMAVNGIQAISFNPTGFKAGDNVTIGFNIKNNGMRDGNAWVRFLIYDKGYNLSAIDSVPFALAAGASMTVNRQMLFAITQGFVVAQIVNCSPDEFDLLNNSDTLAFSTVATLNNGIIVNGNLDMALALPNQLPGWIGGSLILGDNNLTVNGQVINYDSTHFIITNGAGKLFLNNSNPVNTFPVGTSLTSNNFVTINNSGTPDNFAVSVVPYVLGKGIAGDTLKTGYVKRTWLMEEAIPGGSNAMVTFYWKPADEQPGFDRSQSKAAHYTSSWQLGGINQASTDSIAEYFIAQAGYSSFSPFTVTSTSAPLPLTLLSFSAVAQQPNALLTWQTSNEIDSKQFIIQDYTAGAVFEDVGVVNAVNAPGIHNYSFVHAGLQAGVHYYRLKMVDLDGVFTYSEVKAVRITGATEMALYPNPAHQYLTVTGLLPNSKLELLTPDGRLIREFISSGNKMQLEVGGLAGGLYIIRCSDATSRQEKQFLKE